jgi:hypothetical protein
MWHIELAKLEEEYEQAGLQGKPDQQLPGCELVRYFDRSGSVSIPHLLFE